MNNKIKGSESYFSAILLTLGGGFLDAYTYFSRGGVFANAQTGNLIKLGIHFVQKDYSGCVRFLIPICSFTLAILLSLTISYHLKKREIPFVKRTVLLIEILLLGIVSCIPLQEEYNIIANSIVSFVCAMQMQIFSKFEIGTMTTTVSTGNLRKAIEIGFQGYMEKNVDKKRISLQYFGIVFTFICGTMLGTIFTQLFSIHSVLFPCGFYTITFLWITYRYIKNKD